jgi:signal transduction histidine kinase
MKKYSDIIDPLLDRLKRGSTPEERHVAFQEELITYFDADACAYIVLKVDCTSMYCKVVARKDYDKLSDQEICKQCEDKIMNRGCPVANSLSDLGSKSNLCDKLCPHRVLIPIYSYWNNGESRAVNSIFCILNPRIELENDDIEELSAKLSGLFLSGIELKHERTWSNLYRKVRQAGSKEIPDVYSTILKALEDLRPMYATLLMYTETRRTEADCAERYLIKQVDRFYGEYKDKDPREYNRTVLVDLDKHNDFRIPIVVELTNEWYERISTHPDSEHYCIEIRNNNKEESLFINEGLNELPAKKIIFAPIIQFMESEARYRGLLVMFVHPSFNDLSFYSPGRFEQLSQIIISAIKEAVLTTRSKIYERIGEIAPQLSIDEAKYGEKVVRIITETLHCEDAIVALRAEDDSRFDSFYHALHPRVIEKFKEVYQTTLLDHIRELESRIKARREMKTSFYTIQKTFRDNESALFVGISRKQEKPKAEGIIYLRNKISDVNNSVIPFRREDVDIARYIGQLLATYNESQKFNLRVQNYFRIIPHEIGMCAAALLLNIEARLKRYNTLPEDRRFKMQQDMESNVNLIFATIRNVTTFAQDRSTPDTSIDTFEYFGGVLFKWEKALESRFRGHFQRLVYPKGYQDIKTRPKIRANRTYIEQITYNLLTNAEKYSHPGTLIKVDYYADESAYHFLVTNWGMSFDVSDFERLCQLGTRGREAKDEGLPGMGAGLHIINRLSSWTNMNFVAPSNILISEYNLPVIKCMLSTGKVKNYNLTADEIKQVEEEIQSDEFREMWNDTMTPSEMETMLINFEHDLRKPTYKVTFHLTMPINR